MTTTQPIDERIERWRQRLAEAIGRGLDERRGVELFWEDRRDLSVTLAPDGEIRATPTCLRGLALRRAGGTTLFRAEPGPDDPDRLLGDDAQATAAEVLPAVDEAEAGQPRGPEVELAGALSQLEALREAAERACPTAAFRVRWIGFDQAIVVARTGGLVSDDRRRGRRVRLDGWLGRDGLRSHAAGDAVVPDEPRRARKTLDRLAADVAGRLQLRMRATSMISGDYPVVFAPGVGGVLAHELVGHAIEADTVLRRGSWLASLDPGTRVGLQELSILDDPRRGRGAWRVDDEGVPARPTALVREGRLVQPLTDRRTARAARLSLTGHGRCGSFRDPVLPRMGCTFITAGRADPDEALEGIVDGLYIRRMEAAHVDTAAGTAVFRVSDADRLVNGALDRPLTPFVMTIDAARALSTIERIAGDLAFDTCVGSCLRDGQALAATVGAPTFRIPLISALFIESAA